MQIAVPRKPFDTYKWRWATFAPTEGLNDPAVFLGVLRVLRDHEGQTMNSEDVHAALADVDKRLAGRTEFGGRLARDSERNVVRNSGQYWKALGVLADTAGGIELTDFGREVADGRITRNEFAAATIATMTLPNRRIETPAEIQKWDAARLQIQPLRLLLGILAELERSDPSGNSSYLTTDELTRIIIPLAGERVATAVHVAALHSYRKKELSVEGWPDCTPAANDRRMAREFLRFLHFYGFVRRISADFFLADRGTPAEFTAIESLSNESLSPRDVALESRYSASLLFVERNRVTTEVLARPEQPAFRKRVLETFGGACFLSKESTAAVLEAAHIIPVRNHGSDGIENGICLRSDIHTLFDGGHIRLSPTGDVELSDLLVNSVSYSRLAAKVTIPSTMSVEALRWRWEFE